ncbi:prepilin peptidase [Marisediminicola senii]|uniref:prepilin peptidase n=1 Tax=Marisediminicola senii TaxID=2711233 RepID=UPI0013EA0E9F|nr:A24 family peptidase [Marisediminicola senii]
MTALLLTFIALFGLAIGSFLNVVVWRVPRGESLNHPPSACPRCGHAIRARDNIPVLGWLLLRGKCRDCGEPIAPRYPLVEALTGVVFVLVALELGLDAPGLAALPAFLYLAAISIALALIDLDTHRLPNAIVLPSYPVALVLLAVASGVANDWGALLRAVIGGAVLFSAYLILALAVPRGMGLGDVKLAGVLGIYLAWLGWGSLAVGAFGAFLLGGIFSIGLLVTKRASRSSGIPFGPWMIGGAALGFFFGEQLADAYLVLVGIR